MMLPCSEESGKKLREDDDTKEIKSDINEDIAVV